MKEWGTESAAGAVGMGMRHRAARVGIWLVCLALMLCLEWRSAGTAAAAEGRALRENSRSSAQGERVIGSEGMGTADAADLGEITGGNMDTDAADSAVPGEITEGWPDIDRFLKEELKNEGNPFTFSELARLLMEGRGREAGRLILDGAEEALLGEIRRGSRLTGQLLALGLIGAVFAGFSELFSGGQIAEAGFFMTYLLAFILLAAAFLESAGLAGELLTRQVTFMKVLLPSYLMAAAWSGAPMTSAAWYEMALLLISAVTWLYQNLQLPLIRVYILLVLAGNMVREEMLSGMQSLLKSAVGWMTKSLIGLVLGFQLIQGMVLPYADSVKSAGLQKLISAIPGLGNAAGTVTKLVLGSGVLIKNSMGAAAVVCLILLSIMPVIKLTVLLIFYRVVAAVLEPVADRRLTGCISGVAEGQQMLLGLVTGALVLFIITIALICAGTNVSFLA